MPNHLEGQSSRYLQQHADNPVDWYPWCDEALARARREDKPIFLSIGYSACHWCHVMAHESFEDEATAAVLNEHFVSIKVDREERPDLDRIYMGAVQAMIGSGGWPMSVFLTPDGTPFYGGTYFPKEPRYNMPAFGQLLEAIAEAWKQRRTDLLKNTDEMLEILTQQQAAGSGGGDDALGPATIEAAYRAIRERFDPSNGGWRGAPKFPQPMALEFLLRYHHTTGDAQALEMVTTTLEAMARGGIYDQLGGGFHRYSVDAHWLVPHFEKMLYDNAQLARVYLHAWQVLSESRIANHRSQTEGQESGVTSDESRDGVAALFRAVVEETLDYVVREMMAPEGGFYATQDADSEGEEGKFFVWTPEEIREALGGPATRFLELYGVTEAGNFEGSNILTFDETVEERQAIAGARRLLFETRSGRVAPGRDEKILTSWNGLMLAAFAEAAVALQRDDYLHVAERNAGFLLRELRGPDGRLWHVWKDGIASVPGFLEDYAYLIEGLMALYQTTFAPRWFTAAAELAEAMVGHFRAAEGSLGGAAAGKAGDLVGFFDTADDAESLIVRPRELQDNAVPSGNAMAVTVLQKLARLGLARDGVDPDTAAEVALDYEERARRSLASMGDLLGEHPLAFAQWLIALDDALATPVEVAIAGDPADPEARALIVVAQDGYQPHRLLAAGLEPPPGVLADRGPLDGRPAAYICRNRVCQAPVTDPEKMRRLLS